MVKFNWFVSVPVTYNWEQTIKEDSLGGSRVPYNNSLQETSWKKQNQHKSMSLTNISMV